MKLTTLSFILLFQQDLVANRLDIDPAAIPKGTINEKTSQFLNNRQQIIRGRVLDGKGDPLYRVSVGV
ncbi:hypothetical protein BWD42_12875 [Sphingobacterium sp. CZ-UAM]|uniref:hypothetical protein n=1 Tax=Sphingobacterium sp. CZ-UAM TaxID=1933868 RepID=UPI000986EC50|nr:hypothetical protein [Sphingobacterium sp. CZ-UAM]OOG18156.1 hypothetical protein BWD42_12875 [Sphingobacterium sp. CZ-UAM]